ncbi:hypothetical protein KKA14_09915 [bacterium]|nr:hypothetical protein [bacterium]
MSGHQNKMLLFLLFLLFFGCSKTVIYERPSENIKPLNTKVSIIILHDDYLIAEGGTSGLKKQLIQAILQKMQSQKKFELIHIQSGGKVPENQSKNGYIFLMGNVWKSGGDTSGNEVVKVTKYSSGANYNRSWEELESRHWDQKVLQTAISLYFVEITSELKMLRSTLTVSNDKNKSGSGFSAKQYSDFYKDTTIAAGHILINAEGGLSSDDVEKELATKAVGKHFESL